MLFSSSRPHSLAGIVLPLALAILGLQAFAQSGPTLSPELQRKIDQVARESLAQTGVPSASVAIVKDGQLAYLQAYGDARLEPPTPARPDMRYSIGSISKEFASVALLMLQEQGKLSLDDKVAKYLPDLTRANEISIRQLLSHTAGYQDYWPQDYVPPMMRAPISAAQILEQWARKPLDFDPGTQWQYSNTGYVVAGVIVQKVSNVPLFQFLRENIFVPLGMKSVVDVDHGKLTSPDPAGYMRYALGPLRISPKEGQGWIFAAGELAMTAEDLAKWDVSIIEQKLMKPSSYRELETETLLKNGMGTQYALGLDVRREFGHRMLSHGGEVSGFTSENVIFPDDRAAVVVLTNQDAARASTEIPVKISPLLFTLEDPVSTQKLEQAKKIFAGLQRGTIERQWFSENANDYFSSEALKDFAASLGPLGTPEEFVQLQKHSRGGMVLRIYQVKFPRKMLRLWTYETPDGKLEQYLAAAAE
jgi:D-alanyl-D-alanine carboxypeptidase